MPLVQKIGQATIDRAMPIDQRVGALALGGFSTTRYRGISFLSRLARIFRAQETVVTYEKHTHPLDHELVLRLNGIARELVLAVWWLSDIND